MLPGAALRPAHAALPDEIQVYVDDLNDPGRFSLQMHLNTTPVGVETPSYPGETVAAQGVRATAEFAYGVNRDLEAGMYLPFVHASDGDTSLAGLKFRLKWVPVRPPDGGNGTFAGLNFEISQVQERFNVDRRGLEFRPILGWRSSEWLLAVNPVLDFALEGPDRYHGPEVQPQFKVARTVAPGFAAGIEYYADLGRLDDIENVSNESHTLYLAIDVDRGPWNINFGIGRGLTSVTDRWTVKMIIDIPLGH